MNRPRLNLPELEIFKALQNYEYYFRLPKGSATIARLQATTVTPEEWAKWKPNEDKRFKAI